MTDGTVLGGIVPYSDASGYLEESSRLITGDRMTPWGARRPLADTYLAGLLYLARWQIPMAMMFAGLLSGSAIGLAAVEVRQKLGLAAALFWTWLVLAYSRRYVGEMLSEQAGIALGSLSVALLLRDSAERPRPSLWAGLLMLSFALNARSGAMFVLPAMAVSTALRWRTNGSLRIFVLAVLSIAIGFLISSVYGRLLGPRDQKAISNYHYIAYSAVFGVPWQQTAVDIPNFSRMNESEQAAAVYNRIGAALKAHPSLIWLSAARSWKDFFRGAQDGLGPFSFLRQPSWENRLLWASGLGILCSLLWRQGCSYLVLGVGVGIIFSVPFVPTSDKDMMRAYAATMPLMVIVPAFAVSSCCAWLARSLPRVIARDLVTTEGCKEEGAQLLFCSSPCLVVMLVLPLIAHFVAPLAPAASIRQVGARADLTVNLENASWISLTPSEGNSRSDVRAIPAELFASGIYGSFRYFYPKQAAFLDLISRPGVAIICPYSTETSYIVIRSEHLVARERRQSISGKEIVTDAADDPVFLEDGVLASATPPPKGN